jgi:predicted dehydrogenase
MSRPLRLGVIGAGAWALASHLPNLARRREEVDFVAVNRRDPEALSTVREMFGFQYASTEYQDVLTHDIDICVISSPVAFHHEQGMAALAAGAHVLIEKPFTVTPAQAWELTREAKRRDRHLVVALGNNYLPLSLEARKLLTDDGGIGRIEELSVVMSSTTREAFGLGPMPEFSAGSADRGFVATRETAHQADPLFQSQDATLRDPAVAAGGYAQVQLSHALGLALWLTELRGHEVFAFMAPRGEAIEFHDAISVRYRGGAVGTVSGGSHHLGANQNKHAVEIRAIGARGQIHVDLERELVWRYRPPDEDARIPLSEGDGRYTCEGPIDALVDLALGRAVTNNSPGELAARTVEILDAAYRSADSGAVEAIALPPDLDAQPAEPRHA